MESAAHFRSEAAKCRSLAKTVRDPMTTKNLLALAADYDEQALDLDRETGPQPIPRPE